MISKKLLFLLLLISCKTKYIYLYDYCAIEIVNLTEESKKIEPRSTKENIVYNNLLKQNNCKN